MLAGQGAPAYTRGMQEVVQEAGFHGIMPVAFLIGLAGVAAAVCCQCPARSFAGKMVFGALCALLLSLGCAAAGVSALPVHILLVLVLGLCVSKCGWRRTVLSLGCWAFVTYMLWMGLRVLPCDAAALAFAQGKLLPAVVLPCALALLLSVRKSPVRFWGAFFGVFLVLYLMEAAGMAWEHFVPRSILPGAARLLRESVLGAAELALMLVMFLWVLQASCKRAFLVLALYSLRTAYVLCVLIAPAQI